MKKLVYKAISVLIAIIATSSLSSCNYNSLVAQKQDVDQKWAAVENQYQRRADLIPNLVNTVKGYAEHESNTLESVTKARTGLSDAMKASQSIANPQENLEQYQAAQEQLSKNLSIYVNAVKEAYPDLKANENFIGLQTQLEGTENRISTERMRYTEAVRDYNTVIKKFPTVIYAGWFGFNELPQFKAQPSAEKAPEVNF